MDMHPVVSKVTERIRQRSRDSRASYLRKIEGLRKAGPYRGLVSCSNLAHSLAACSAGEKRDLSGGQKPNIAIVSAYNDMLSAHQPFERYPDLIKTAVKEAGGVAQFAGGTPAMCDGVTQGQNGMELSLFSRDVIALSTAIALSHNVFDGVVCLGVCDKIVPGLLIGSLSFGHLPVIFVPAGPMPSGLPNPEKAAVRERHAAGQADRRELLEAESKSYHSPGTCTFYGTANSNQLLMEVMGLHLPGASFLNPGTEIRDALTRAAARRITELTHLTNNYTPLSDIIDEPAVVNAIVGLLASGGSTNHTIHLVAIAAAAGIRLTWDDFAELSAVTPLLARIYPNGAADVNQFHAAGDSALLMKELLAAGLLHEDVRTVAGKGLSRYTQAPALEGDQLTWKESAGESLDENTLRPVASPFAHEGGLRVLAGNLGRAIVKASAVNPEHWAIEAPAEVFLSQDEFIHAYRAGRLEKDFIAVVKYQGPKANGMPELHKLSPLLSVLQARGYKVALLTDGRMSGASGNVLAAIHVTPETLDNSPLAKIQNGDLISIDVVKGSLNLNTDKKQLEQRNIAQHDKSISDAGMGRELFACFRANISNAEEGASIFLHDNFDRIADSDDIVGFQGGKRRETG